MPGSAEEGEESCGSTETRLPPSAHSTTAPWQRPPTCRADSRSRPDRWARSKTSPCASPVSPAAARHPCRARPAVAIFAGDHGVHAQGVSPWPQDVTGQMVAQLPLRWRGGQRIRAADGCGRDRDRCGPGHAASPMESYPSAWSCGAVRAGTGRYRRRAGTHPRRGQHRRSRSALDVAAELVANGHDTLLTGDMGIGNTTPAAALIAAFTGAPATAVTGRGTGIDDAMLAHKQSHCGGGAGPAPTRPGRPDRGARGRRRVGACGPHRIPPWRGRVAGACDP